MKSTTKLFAITAAIIVVALFSTNVKAQSTTTYGQVNFNVGLNAGVPTYDARQLSNFVLGGTGQFQLGLSNYLAATVTSGFYNFFDKTSTINGASVQEPGLGLIPVEVGLKIFLGGGIYLAGSGGAGFETSIDDATNSKDIKGLLSGGLGYTHNAWDIGVNYDSFSGQDFNYGVLSLRLAYGFKL